MDDENGSSVTMSSAKDRGARTFKKHFDGKASPEHTFNLGLERCYNLRVFSEEQNDQFGCVLWSADQIEWQGASKISELHMRCSYITKSHTFLQIQ